MLACLHDLFQNKGTSAASRRYDTYGRRALRPCLPIVESGVGGSCRYLRFLLQPQALLQAERHALRTLADAIDRAGFPALAWLLHQPAQAGQSLIVVAVRYFFRREIESDQYLRNLLILSNVEDLGRVQEEALHQLDETLDQHGQRLEEALDEVADAVICACCAKSPGSAWSAVPNGRAWARPCSAAWKTAASPTRELKPRPEVALHFMAISQPAAQQGTPPPPLLALRAGGR